MTRPAFAQFATAYARHHRALWSYLVRLGAAGEVAEDLSQDAFVRWLNKGQGASNAAQVRSFLFTTATRLLTDRWRRERHLVAWDDADPATVCEPAGADIRSSRAWLGLTKREQQLLWLAYAEEFSHAEIAVITGLARASVKVLLSRARNHLEATLEMPGDYRD